MTAIFITICVALLALCIVLYLQLRRTEGVAETLREDIKRCEGEHTLSKIELGRVEALLESERKQHAEEMTQQRNVTAAQLKEQRDIQREEQERREKQLSDHFKTLSADILREQSKNFKQSNSESMEQLLKPFSENITSFKERVETIYNFENEQRGALRNELERLMELNRRITSETHNLTSALRGNSKVQGDWGEMILDTILESSNLVRGTHYTTQQNIKDEEGNNLRPDVVLKLPEGKEIVIDSKCSLTAFVNYVNEEEPTKRRQYMDGHIVSVRQHIKELSAKEYQTKVLHSPDFVIMFIPSEPAFLAALQSDSSLWSEAYDKRVIISSPTNLFALLKLVDDLWKRNDQSKNTADIVLRGTKLYEQLVNFVSSLEGVGSALDNARVKYDDAYKRLCTGNDNIIRNGERLRTLGLPTKKRQSAKAMVNNDSELEEELPFGKPS